MPKLSDFPPGSAAFSQPLFFLHLMKNRINLGLNGLTWIARCTLSLTAAIAISPDCTLIWDSSCSRQHHSMCLVRRNEYCSKRWENLGNYISVRFVCNLHWGSILVQIKSVPYELYSCAHRNIQKMVHFGDFSIASLLRELPVVLLETSFLRITSDKFSLIIIFKSLDSLYFFFRPWIMF